MSEKNCLDTFQAAVLASGATFTRVESREELAAHIAPLVSGSLLLPAFDSATRLGLAGLLRDAGCTVIDQELRSQAATASAGLTGANFAIAETGTLVLESTPEDIRLASTLPEKHFVLLHPDKIVADAMDAVPLLRRFHQEQPRNYLAYITGPSRTADIERVLTIGVHGPKELHVLLCDQLSSDPLCM